MESVEGDSPRVKHELDYINSCVILSFMVKHRLYTSNYVLFRQKSF